MSSTSPSPEEIQALLVRLALREQQGLKALRDRRVFREIRDQLALPEQLVLRALRDLPVRE
jgi:hypothetical protein